MRLGRWMFFAAQGDTHPIVPVMLHDARLATEFANEMLSKSISLMRHL